jgi:hypothetical protein
MHGRIAAPVDEGPEHGAVAKPGKRAADPGDVESEELFIRHFARRHGEFPVARAGDVPLDRNVVGFVALEQSRPALCGRPVLVASGDESACGGFGRPVAEAVLQLLAARTAVAIKAQDR